MSIEIDTYDWQQAVARYAAGTDKGMREGLYEEWPFLVGKMMEFTPPFRPNSLRNGNSASDMSVGRAAVNRDVRKTMRPFSPVFKKKSALSKAVITRDIRTFNIIAQRVKSGPMAGATALPFSPSIHTDQRNSRGRVGKGYQYVILGPEVALFKRYLKRTVDKVGIAKSGWLSALFLVGGTAPAYVSRHGTSYGAVIDDHANEDPSITAINRTPWASRRDEGQRIVKAAYASRAVQITAKLRAKLLLAAKNAGLTVNAA